MAQVNIDVAKEASVQAVNTKVGASSDTASNTPTTLFAGIKKIISWFTDTWTVTRAGYVDTINTNTVVNNTASKTGTLSQKESYGISLLENATYGLSALKTAIAGGNVPVIKSVQRGYISSFTDGSANHAISISAINPAKSIVILNGNHATSSNNWFPNINSLTNNTLTISLGGSWTSSIVTKVSWQVIEFY